MRETDVNYNFDAVETAATYFYEVETAIKINAV